jgi:hypothetical protein
MGNTAHLNPWVKCTIVNKYMQWNEYAYWHISRLYKDKWEKGTYVKVQMHLALQCATNQREFYTQYVYKIQFKPKSSSFCIYVQEVEYSVVWPFSKKEKIKFIPNTYSG